VGHKGHRLTDCGSFSLQCPVQRDVQDMSLLSILHRPIEEFTPGRHACMQNRDRSFLSWSFRQRLSNVVLHAGLLEPIEYER